MEAPNSFFDPLMNPSKEDIIGKEWKETSLSSRQEIYLKKLLLKSVLEHELKIFGASMDSNSSNNVVILKKRTILLSFLYTRFLVEFPLFKSKENTILKINEMLVRSLFQLFKI